MAAVTLQMLTLVIAYVKWNLVESLLESLYVYYSLALRYHKNSRTGASHELRSYKSVPCVSVSSDGCECDHVHVRKMRGHEHPDQDGLYHRKYQLATADRSYEQSFSPIVANNERHRETSGPSIHGLTVQSSEYMGQAASPCISVLFLNSAPDLQRHPRLNKAANNPRSKSSYNVGTG